MSSATKCRLHLEVERQRGRRLAAYDWLDRMALLRPLTPREARRRAALLRLLRWAYATRNARPLPPQAVEEGR